MKHLQETTTPPVSLNDLPTYLFFEEFSLQPIKLNLSFMISAAKRSGRDESTTTTTGSGVGAVLLGVATALGAAAGNIDEYAECRFTFCLKSLVYILASLRIICIDVQAFVRVYIVQCSNPLKLLGGAEFERASR